MSGTFLNPIRKLLLNACSLLPKHSSLTAKFRRLAYGQSLKHMRNVSAAFFLEPTSNPDVFDILWNKKKLGRTHPFPVLEEHDDLWLMATGPSINTLDLSQLKDRTLMGLNGAIATCAEHSLTPKYYAITDRDFFEHRMELVKLAVQSGAHCFFSFNGLARICEQCPELLATAKISLLETVNRHYGLPQLEEQQLVSHCSNSSALILPSAQSPKVGWSHDIVMGVFTANTIAYIGCQIASYLKARNVFILGLDLSDSSPSQNARSYESGQNARPTTISKDYEKTISPAFQLLSTLSLSTNFYNLSEASRLPSSVLQKISFTEALSLSR